MTDIYPAGTLEWDKVITSFHPSVHFSIPGGIFHHTRWIFIKIGAPNPCMVHTEGCFDFVSFGAG